MKSLALVMMFVEADLPFLKLHLPAIKGQFDGIVAITDDLVKNQRAADFMVSQGSHIILIEFNNNWAEAFNKGYQWAEHFGYESAVRLDPDELVFPDFADLTRRLLEDWKVIASPRHEFFPDRLHYRPSVYPDYQLRAFRLREGIKLQGARHEGVDLDGSNLKGGVGGDILWAEKPEIFHYGWVGSKHIKQQALKYINVIRAEEGLELLKEPPKETEDVFWPNELFKGKQPLDPLEIGATAPFDS